MIKIKNNTATREALPQFLVGLLPVSLLDLSWTDPQLNVQDCAWWPEENADTPIDANTQKYGAEILTLDAGRKVVLVSHEVLPLTVEELAEKQAVIDAELAASRAAMTASVRQARLQLLSLGSLDTVKAAIAAMPEAAQIEWEYATEVQRSNPLVAAMAGLLGWSEADTDLYFAEAAKL